MFFKKYNSIKILYIILILLFTFIFCIKGIEIKSANLIKKSVNVLGVDLSYALIDIELDQDLYRYDTLSCPNFDCEAPTNENIDCSCDYTDINECPKKTGRDPSCQECSTIIDGQNACEGNWTVLEYNKRYQYSTQELMNFRIKADASGCKGYSIKVNSIDGFGTSYAGAVTGYWYMRYSSSASPQRNTLFNICPSDNWNTTLHDTFTKSWTKDTLFIIVNPTTYNYTFSIEIKKYDVPSGEIKTDQCTNIDSEHQCITTNKVMYGEGQNSESIYFSYQVPSPGYYFFNAPSIFQSTFFYISTDPNNKKPTGINSYWELAEEYDNYLYLYLNESIEYLYITAVSTYATNFTFSICDQGVVSKFGILSNLSSEEAAFSLTSTSRIILENGGVLKYSTYYNSDPVYSVLYPQQDISPMFPVPSYFYSSLKFSYLKIFNNITQYNSFKPNSYQAAVLLSTSIGKTNINKYFDFETILNSKLEFLSTIFTKDGVALNNIIGFKEKLIECNDTEFNQVLKLIQETQSVLFNVSDADELNNYRYTLDSLQMTNGWIGCSNLAVDLLNIESVVKNVSLKYCPYNSNQEEYFYDPCCNSIMQYYQCCNPREASLNFTIYTQGNRELVDQQCSSLDCTLSVLSDYAKSIDNLDACSVPDIEPTKIKLLATTILRQCKSILEPPSCTTDEDCQQYSGQQCNLYTRTCVPDFEIIDRNYIKCVFENLPKSITFSYLKGTVQLDDSTIQTVYDQNLKEDCIGLDSIYKRSKVSWTVDVELSYCYPVENCLDESCITRHDTCREGIYTDWYLDETSHIDDCDSLGFCNYDSSSNIGECGSFDSDFCGYCTNQFTGCHQASLDFDSEASCQDQTICLLPNGEYKIGLNEQQCQNDTFHCSEPCGYKCSSNLQNNQMNACLIFTNDMDETKCLTSYSASGISTNWDGNMETCIATSITTQQQCADLSFKWVDCSNKGEGECMGPIENLYLCYLEPVECTTKEDCLNNAGRCSDDFYFDPKLGNPYYPFGAGKCVFKHATYQFGITCDDSEGTQQNDSPEGCYFTIPVYLTKFDCENHGGNWWVPARNKTSCESKMGCKVLEDQFVVTNLPFNYYFNEMDEESCYNCYQSFNQYTNKFKWTNAQYLPGIFKSTQWIETKFISNQIESQFNYQLFYKNIMYSTSTVIADLFRSESYCRLQQLQNNLNSITCSCNDKDSSSSCFKLSPPAIGLSKPCTGEESTFSFDFGYIEFTNSSIASSCGTVMIYTQSKELYTSSRPESLASNFVEYLKPDKYGVVNDNGAVIGTLLSDGIMIQSQDGLAEAIICFVVSTDNNEKYPLFDFALQLNNESSPKPLEIDIWFEKNNETLDTLICSLVFDISNKNPIYFPINRISNYQDEVKQVFDSTQKGLMYTLAVLFTIVTLWGIFEIGYIIFNYYHQVKKNIQLVHLLIFIVTLFILIRAVYFFIMPSGSLSDSPVIDYILVVLPTFIYFTAFTIVIVLWYAIQYILQRKKRAESLTRRIYITVGIINVFLYLLFIAIVLVFQYTKQDTNSHECGSRVAISVKSTTPQRVVSIVYGVVQALISLVIGSAFLYLGSSLYFAIRENNNKVGSSKRANHQRKIFTLTCCCSIGFILHCIFVLVMVAANVNSIEFSFACLIVTEIIPAISILYSFDQRNPQQQKSSDGSTTKNTSRSSKVYSKSGNYKLNSINVGSSTAENQSNNSSSSSSYGTPISNNEGNDSSNITP